MIAGTMSARRQRRAASPAAAGRRFNLLMGAILVVVLPADLVLARVVHFNGAGQSLQVWTTALFLGAILWYCRWRPLPRLVDACELAIWAVLYFDALSVLIQIAGRSPRPLIDAQLTAMDARMHFATVTVVHLAAHWRVVKDVFVIAYALEPLLLLTALVYLPFMGHADASRRYVLGIVVAAVMTAGAFALWPAAGPWMTEGYRPTHSQTLATSYLHLLKTQTPVALDMQDAGIVAFPSFHTLLALLSAIALSSMRRLRVAAWVMAGLIMISTLTTGWHYLTDVLGGMVLAAMAVAVVRVVLPAPVAAMDAVAVPAVHADPAAAGVPVPAVRGDGAAGAG